MDHRLNRYSTCLVVAAGILSYWNSFTGDFVFDDTKQILLDPSIRTLPSLWKLLTHTNRPLIALTFALNYSAHGLALWGYHLVNLVIHLLAASTLYGIVRRTLQTSRLAARYEKASCPLALIISLIWMVHPLQTESVTYIIQRAESLMGLFYLLTLYCVIRSAESTRPSRWTAFAILSCALGMASKPILVTAPLLVLWYDRVFLSPSWEELLKRRLALYAGLTTCWGWLALLLAVNFKQNALNAGFWLEKISPWQYALTQTGVILHYLRLSIWPHPLILDYSWPIAQGVKDVWPSLALLAAGTLTFLWKYRRRPELLFLAGWFFLTLAPSSSFIPVADAAFEYRMYLPLAAVVTGLVLLGRHAITRMTPSPARQRLLGIGAAFTAVSLLGSLTALRNRDYQSLVSIWQKVIIYRPQNARAYSNLGVALQEAGQSQEAVQILFQAIRLRPNFPEAHNNLAFSLAQQGHLEEAYWQYREALRLNPNLALAHRGLGDLLNRMGRYEEAAAEYKEAIRLNILFPDVHTNLGLLLQRQGKISEALQEYQEGIRLDPKNAIPYNNIGTVLFQQGKWDEAAEWFSKAIHLDPQYAQAYGNLGGVCQMEGKLKEAVSYYSKALQLQPNDKTTHQNLEHTLTSLEQGPK